MSQMISISLVTLINSHFEKQGSSYYSTLELVNMNAIITNCYFSAEIVEMGHSGGALVMTRSNVSVANSLFVGNHAHSGGAIRTIQGSHLSLESSVFDSNKATWGGAIMISGRSSVHILNSNFSNNTGVYGGAMNIEQSEANIVSSIFSNNSAQSDDFSWSQYGGVLYCNNATVVMDAIIYINN